MPRFLHVGCGQARRDRTLAPFVEGDWDEVTLDIDPDVAPDIVDRLPELARVESGAFDAVYASHCLEHLFPHEVPVALASFRRVLREDGLAIVRCPDLQSVGEALAKGEIDSPLYVSPRGPVAALDMLYGFRPAMSEGNLHMAHHTGFTAASLARECRESGFSACISARRIKSREVWGIAVKQRRSAEELDEILKNFARPL